MFTGYRDAASRNIEPAVTDGLHADPDVYQPVGTTAWKWSPRSEHVGPEILRLSTMLRELVPQGYWARPNP